MLNSFLGGELFGEIQPGPNNEELWVLLHGWARTSADFAQFCSEVAAIENAPWLARFDLPGFGSSPPPEAALSTREYARRVALAINEQKKRMPVPDKVRVVVVGHSFGGRVALWLPSAGLDLNGLLLSGVPISRPRSGASKARPLFRMAKLMHRVGLVSDARIEKSRRKYGSFDYANAQGVMRGVLVKAVNEDYTFLLKDLDLPVSLLWGEQDRTAPVEVAERAVEVRPDKVSLTTVPGDHFAVIKSPGVLLEGVRGLIKRTEN